MSGFNGGCVGGFDGGYEVWFCVEEEEECVVVVVVSKMVRDVVGGEGSDVEA